MALRSHKTTSPEPAEIVVALDSFVCGVHTVRRGARLRANHPAVLASPRMFCPDGLSDDEYVAAHAELFKRDND